MSVASPGRIVVVGAGVAGASAARTLRNDGYDGDIVLVGAETQVPYERPPLSKEYLQEADGAGVTPFLDSSWYVEHEVELRLGIGATALSLPDRVVELADGTRLTADAVLLATGGRPRVLDGMDPSERILQLRTAGDADRIRSVLATASRLAVVGAGFIGCEVAASARERGVDVTVLEMLDAPLERVLGSQIGDHLAELHRAEGVDLRTGVVVDHLESGDDGVRVRLGDGTVVEADALLVGVGMVPNVELAAMAGLEVDGGIVVDELCRTAVPEVLAVGDVARHRHPLVGGHVRVEHFDHAVKQGAAAARTMLGRGTPYLEPHWFWSDQYDYSLQYVGHAERWAQVVVRGWPEDNEFSAWYLGDDGRLLATFGLDAAGDVLAAKEMIAARLAPDPAALTDIDVDLFELAGVE